MKITECDNWEIRISERVFTPEEKLKKEVMDAINTFRGSTGLVVKEIKVHMAYVCGKEFSSVLEVVVL